MNEATIAITAMTGSIAAIFLGLFIWGLVKGQFRNVQEGSRRMYKNNIQMQPNPHEKNKPQDTNPQAEKGGDKS